MSYDFDDFDQPLRAPEGARFPTVKFAEVGDRVVGMVVDYDDAAPLYVYGTNERKITANGKEATKDVLTLLLMDGTTCPISLGGDDALQPDEVPGAVARVHIQGHNRWTPEAREAGIKPAWRNAVEAHGDFRRGCVVLGQFEATTRVGAGGARLTQDKKLIGWAIRNAKPEEAHLVEKARAEYRRIKEQRAATAEQPAGFTRPAPVPVSVDDAF